MTAKKRRNTVAGWAAEACTTKYDTTGGAFVGNMYVLYVHRGGEGLHYYGHRNVEYLPACCAPCFTDLPDSSS